jgi:hypothetical protein
MKSCGTCISAGLPLSTAEKNVPAEIGVLSRDSPSSPAHNAPDDGQYAERWGLTRQPTAQREAGFVEQLIGKKEYSKHLLKNF